MLNRAAINFTRLFQISNTHTENVLENSRTRSQIILWARLFACYSHALFKVLVVGSNYVVFEVSLLKQGTLTLVECISIYPSSLRA